MDDRHLASASSLARRANMDHPFGPRGPVRRLRAYLPMLLLCIGVCLFSGCKSKKTGLEAPKFGLSPEQTVEKILSEYDTNGDRALETTELTRSPSLKTLLVSMDKVKVGKITAEELLERIKLNQSSTIKAASIHCQVKLDGKDLADAVVTLTAESFHGPGIARVTGKTGADGRAELKAEGDDGVVNAFYRVSISKLVGGSETIPATYNSGTTLGAEVGTMTVSRGGKLDFLLKNH